MTIENELEKLNEEITNSFRERLISTLKTSICTVTFLKTDGTVREMKCTLKQDLLDEYFPVVESDVSEIKPEKKKRLPNPDLISVVDVDLKQWRSFKINSIMKIESKTT
jgi:hypothetical protein